MYKNPTKNCGYLPIKIKKPETLTLFFDVTRIKHNDSCFLFIKREPKVITLVKKKQFAYQISKQKKGGNADGCSGRGTVRGAEL